MKPLRISVAVITDLETDQRVRKVCTWMQQQGYDLVVTGLKRPFSTQLQERPYTQNRLITRQQKGVLFYAEWQWKLFWALRKLPSDVIYANDLDTLFPAWLAAKIHGAALVYDSHEWFTEVPELLNQPFKKWIWKKLEAFLVPKTAGRLTVNASIAQKLKEAHGFPFMVLRNVPNLVSIQANPALLPAAAQAKFCIVLQGNGINIDRGAEEAIRALHFLPDQVHLILVGAGDVFPLLPGLIEAEGLQNRVSLFHRMPYEQMMQLAASCQLGLSLDKNRSGNYLFSLPNKVFDYWMAGIPVLASNLPELQALIHETGAGVLCEAVEPKLIAQAILPVLESTTLHTDLCFKAKKAAALHCWDHEQQTLQQLFQNMVL
jgi:glycosyltransferase involved in cell wall biosynthesis